MDSNALYYTLSTIAQTLAGALAILVAVVLFKLAALSKAIETAKERLRSLSVNAGNTWPILRDKRCDVLAQTLAKPEHGVAGSGGAFGRREGARARRRGEWGYTVRGTWCENAVLVDHSALGRRSC